MHLTQLCVFHVGIKSRVHAGIKSLKAVKEMPFEQIDLQKGNGEHKDNTCERRILIFVEFIFGFELAVAV